MHNMVTMFKALSDKNRLRVMAALTAHNELCACQITELLEVTGATTSRHLSVLTASGLLTSRKEGRWVFFRIFNDRDNINTPDVILDWMKTEFTKSDTFKTDMGRLKQILTCNREELCRKQRGEACCPL